MAATSKVHHTQLQDLPKSVTNRFKKGGLRSGEPPRSSIQAQEMLLEFRLSHAKRPSRAELI
ncbi:hypothetical protein CEN44_17350, partial [Fischerella muscicola CCMEE 5323]